MTLSLGSIPVVDWKSAIRVISEIRSSRRPVPIKRHEVVAAADMMLANKYLRDGGPAVRALDHLLASLPPIVDRNFPIFHAFGLKQLLGPPAIGAKGLGIDLDCSLRRFLQRDT